MQAAFNFASSAAPWKYGRRLYVYPFHMSGISQDIVPLVRQIADILNYLMVYPRNRGYLENICRQPKLSLKSLMTQVLGNIRSLRNVINALT